MNKKERLIAEVFGDNDGTAFARGAAAHARRRRSVKQLAAIVAATTAVAAVLISFRRPPAAAQHPLARIQVPPAVEIISDDELRTHLHDQPVLFLKDQTGITGVIFLADTSASASTAEIIPQ